MNRRGFISRGLAALAGLIALPFCKMSAARTKPTGISTGLGINFYDLAAAAKPESRRRVLVMQSWHQPEDQFGLCERPEVCPITDAWEYRSGAYDWKAPRIAHRWAEIQFEELKKGDHFRLIDDRIQIVAVAVNGMSIPKASSPSMPGWRSGEKDGKGVYVANSDACQIVTRLDLGPCRISGDSTHAIGIERVYPGKSAGFDWYEVSYGDDWLRDKRRKLWDLQGFDRA